MPQDRPAAAAPATSPLPARSRRALGRNGRLTGLQLLLAVLFFVAVEVLVSVLAVLAGAVLHGRIPSADATGVTALDPAGFLLASLIGGALAIGGHLLIVGPIGARPGLAVRGRGKLAEFALGLLIGTLLIALSTAAIALLGGYRVTGLEAHPQLLGPLAIGIFAAFCEEVLFRGALLRLLDGWLGSGVALAITSLLFGLVHVTNPDAGLWGGIAITVEAGLLLGGAYLWTRRLWLPIGLHLAWNTVQSGVFSFAVSGTGEQNGLLRAEHPGSVWISGGDMGVEGSVVTVLVGLAAGIGLLIAAHRAGNLLPRDRRADREAREAAGTDRARPDAAVTPEA